MKNRKLSVLYFVFLVLFSTTCFAQLGTYEPDSILKTLLEPSPFYICVIDPLVFILLIFIFYASIRYMRREKDKTTDFSLWESWILPLITAVILFVVYPYVYCEFFYNIYLKMGIEKSNFPILILPALLCYSKIWGGILLVGVWFVLQPIVLHLFQKDVIQMKSQLSGRFLLIFMGFFSFWFIFSLFRPLIGVRVGSIK